MRVKIIAGSTVESVSFINMLASAYKAWAERHGCEVARTDIPADTSKRTAVELQISGTCPMHLETGLHRWIGKSGEFRVSCFATVLVDDAVSNGVCRSYATYPYKAVTDYVSGCDGADVSLVLSGDFSPFYGNRGHDEKA